MIKFIVPSQLLTKNLQNISGILAPNKNVPIVEHVLFKIEGLKLTLLATDLETTMTTLIDLSTSEGDGTLVMPAKLILETIKTLADVPVIFNIDDDYGIKISAGEANYSLVGWDAEQFPKLIEMDNSNTFDIPAPVLVNAISRTAFATGNAEMRPVMAGVFCQLFSDNIIFVATDAHRLVRFKDPDIQTGVEASLIIPKKPLLQLKNIALGLDETITVSYNDARISFKVDETSIMTKLIEGKYPNYEAVIPKNNTNILQVERQELLQKMKNISLYANQSTYQIRMKIEPTKLTLTAEDVESSTRGIVNLACVFESDQEDFEIGFSSKFLQEILSNMTSTNVIFKFSHPTGAGLVFEAEEEQIDENLLMLIMPVMLNN